MEQPEIPRFPNFVNMDQIHGIRHEDLKAYYCVKFPSYSKKLLLSQLFRLLKSQAIEFLFSNPSYFLNNRSFVSLLQKDPSLLLLENFKSIGSIFFWIAKQLKNHFQGEIDFNSYWVPLFNFPEYVDQFATFAPKNRPFSLRGMKNLDIFFGSGSFLSAHSLNWEWCDQIMASDEELLQYFYKKGGYNTIYIFKVKNPKPSKDNSSWNWCLLGLFDHFKQTSKSHYFRDPNPIF